MKKRREPAPRAAFAPSGVGRADLLWALKSGGEPGLASMARVLGFEERAPSAREAAVEAAPTLRLVRDAPTPERPLAPTPFWRLEQVEHLAPLPAPPTRSDKIPDLEAIGRLDGAQPKISPLASEARLTAALKRRLISWVPSRRVDIGTLAARWSRGLASSEIPYLRLAGWAPRVTVLIDRSQRLIPFRHDQDRVLDLLRRRLGKRAIREIRYFEGFALPWSDGRHAAHQPSFEAEGPVLALSDLGFHADNASRRRWGALAQHAQRLGLEIFALVPSATDRWHGGLAQSWRATAWERPGRAVEAGIRLDPNDRVQRAERLLALASTAVRVEPGLLRALRRLLPANEADASTEADAWNHPEVLGGFSPAATLRRGLRDRLQASFSQESPELKAAVVRTLRAWRAGQPKELWFDEVLALDSAADLPNEVLSQTDLGEARDFWRDLGETVATPGAASGRVLLATEGFIGRSVLDRIPDAAWQQDLWAPLLARAWRLAWKGPGPPPLPAGIGSGVLDLPRGEPRRGAVWQVEGDLVWNPSTAPLPAGSPLAAMESSDGLVTLAEEGSRWSTPRPLGEGLALPRRSGQLLVLTDRTRATLGRIERPGWARAIGRDRHGLWATLAVGAARQRMRWIPPGRFRMGSPEDEPGRYDWEQPPHLVDIKAGFWLGETPCTQAFWLAVMGGKNPSRFQTPDRPVEQVSWEDCQEFLGKLGQDGEAGEIWRLPSEEEWELACRAGTETATYAGPIEIRGERNAPVLSPIAWYGGNSGVDDLENGWDSTDWKEKEIEHTRAATHPVGQKRANPWGLFDMLGNVWEWCHDADEADMRPDSEGPLRVIRGGSWFTYARHVRAAFRDWHPPGVRNDDLGFRLARGQESALKQGAEPGGAERPTRGRLKRLIPRR